jgi:integrase
MQSLPIPKFRSWSSSWEVYFPKRGATEGQRRFFPTEAAALAEINRWATGKKPAAHISQRKVDILHQCEALLPAGTDVLEAVRFFLEHHQGLTKVTVQTAADSYKLDLKRNASAKYEEEMSRVVDLAVVALGADTVCSSLSRAGLIEVIKAPESYWNRYAMKRAVSCLLTKARELGALKTNPLDGWRFEDAPKATPHTLTNETSQDILDHVLVERVDLIPSFALQKFAGIRTEELCRPDETDGSKRALRWEDLTAGLKVEVPVEVSKTGDRRVITFWPAALTNWLNAFNPDWAKLKGRICPVENLEDIKSKLLTGFADFKQNDFRRTYASNAYALHGALVQDWMGHTDGRMLKKHYRDFVDAEKAKAYFESKPAVQPSNVISISA